MVKEKPKVVEHGTISRRFNMLSEDLKTAKIMIVDDNLIDIRIIIKFLNNAGFNPVFVQSGEEVLGLIESDRPDIILMDIIMQGLDGFEVCKILKSNDKTKDIPIIFMTGLSEPEHKVRGLELGAVDYITKPFREKEILARLTTHLTIQKQKNELEKLNAIKDKLMSNIALEIKYVFNTLLGPSQLLAESAEMFSKNEIKKFGIRLSDAAQNTINILERLLDWTNIQRGIIEIHPQKVDLYDIVQNVVEFYRETAARKNIELTHAVDPETFVNTDLKIADTLLHNLVSNGLKYTASGGSVTISSETENGYESVSVCDTGVGMDEQERQRLFKLDDPLKKPGTENEKGSGLGLILCKDLIQKNNGDIHVDSEPGKGSTFTFTLPHFPS